MAALLAPLQDGSLVQGDSQLPGQLAGCKGEFAAETHVRWAD